MCFGSAGWSLAGWSTALLEPVHALARDVAAQADHIRTLLRSYPALCEHLCALAQLDVLWLAGRRHCLNQCMPWLAMLPLKRIHTMSGPYIALLESRSAAAQLGVPCLAGVLHCFKPLFTRVWLSAARHAGDLGSAFADSRGAEASTNSRMPRSICSCGRRMLLHDSSEKSTTLTILSFAVASWCTAAYLSLRHKSVAALLTAVAARTLPDAHAAPVCTAICVSGQYTRQGPTQ